ncbi:MAG: ribonuclease HIII [Bacilli bacterium]|nr:ribonuclease HIII [Bacilli bacterium]
MNYIFLENQIGSDEVGTGDFFAPIIVVATLIKKNNVPILNELGIKDSKKLTNNQIKIMYRKIVSLKIPYEIVILKNSKFNNIYKKNKNMNAIKSILHNYVLFKLHKKYPQISNFCVDKFTENKEKYYEYLSLSNTKNIVKNILFDFKGEQKFPSVAVASVIARYFLIDYMDKIRIKYKMLIPLGSGENVNIFSLNFIKNYGVNKFNALVKKNFLNYKKILLKLKTTDSI